MKLSRYVTGLLLIAALLLQVGCALNVPRSSGARSGMNQLIDAQTARLAVDKVQWPSQLNEKKVYIDAAALTSTAVDPQYIRTLLQQSMIKTGMRPTFVATQGEADLVVSALVETLGTDNYMPSPNNIVTYILYIPVQLLVSFDFYARSVAQLRILVYAPSESYNDTYVVSKSTTTGQFRVFLGLIGPFRFGSMESVRDE